MNSDRPVKRSGRRLAPTAVLWRQTADVTQAIPPDLDEPDC